MQGSHGNGGHSIHTRTREALHLRNPGFDISGYFFKLNLTLVRGIMGSHKIHKIRKLPMDEDVSEALSRLPRHGLLVFHHGDGEPHTLARTNTVLSRMCLRGRQVLPTFGQPVGSDAKHSTQGMLNTDRVNAKSAAITALPTW